MPRGRTVTGSEQAGRNRDRGRAGFTLLEALVSLTLFAFVLVTILMVYDSTQKTYVRGEARVDLQQNVRVALDQIAHDVRLAGYDPSNAINAQTIKQPLQPVTGTALSSAELRVIADINQDSVSDCVAYRLNNGQILRRQASWTSGACTWTATESAVADSISTVTFTYYPAVGATATTDPAQAKRVKIRITAASTVYNTTFTAETEAAFRQ
jgi:type II secretory pathway component PulJ